MKGTSGERRRAEPANTSVGLADSRAHPRSRNEARQDVHPMDEVRRSPTPSARFITEAGHSPAAEPDTRFQTE